MLRYCQCPSSKLPEISYCERIQVAFLSTNKFRKTKNTKGVKRRHFKFTLKKDLKGGYYLRICKVEARGGGWCHHLRHFRFVITLESYIERWKWSRRMELSHPFMRSRFPEKRSCLVLAPELHKDTLLKH